MPHRALAALAVAAILAGVQAGCGADQREDDASAARVERVIDGDTIVLVGGERVRLVQIDAPEEHSGSECFGAEARVEAERLLRPGTPVRLAEEPATDSIDRFGRLLRYVIRARDGLNVNVELVARGAAAPYFFGRRRGGHARELERLGRRARSEGRGLWGRCPSTSYDPLRGVATGPA